MKCMNTGSQYDIINGLIFHINCFYLPGGDLLYQRGCFKSRIDVANVKINIEMGIQ